MRASAIAPSRPASPPPAPRPATRRPACRRRRRAAPRDAGARESWGAKKTRSLVARLDVVPDRVGQAEIERRAIALDLLPPLMAAGDLSGEAGGDSNPRARQRAAREQEEG